MTRKGDGWRTADELLTELERQPAYIARQREWQARMLDNIRRYQEAASGLLFDLRGAGFRVRNMSELRERGCGNPAAVPILTRWLPRVSYLPLRKDIIATLGSAWARPTAAPGLIEEFRRTDPGTDPPGSIRWAVGDALERVADESVLVDIIDIATDSRHGDQRGLVVTALGNMKKSRDTVVPVRNDQLREPEVAVYAIMGLRKLRAAEARPHIEPFLADPRSWVRREAKKALLRMPSD